MIDTKPNLSDNKFEQCTGDILDLSGGTNVFGQFQIQSGATLSILPNSGVGKILTSNSGGTATWQNNSAITGAVNGLSIDGNNVCLGGSITASTFIYICETEIIRIGCANSGASLNLGAWNATPLAMNGKLQFRNPDTTQTAALTASYDGTIYLETSMSASAKSVCLDYTNGLQYGACYHADYLPRTLVDKEYVDNMVLTGGTGITGATNGLSVDGFNNVCLGGLIIQPTYVPLDYGQNIDIGDSTSGARLRLGNASSPVTDRAMLRYNDTGTTKGGWIDMDNLGFVTLKSYSGATCRIVCLDYSKALEYGLDYSGTYTNRSLVDKEYVDNAILTGSSSTANGQNITKLINQASHGFNVGDVLGWSLGAYTLPIADGTYDGEVLGIVSKCYNVDCFDITQAGYVTGLTGLVTDTTYFLSSTTAGLLTSVEPSGDTQISKAVLIATASDTAWVLPYPGYVITTGTTSGGITLADNGLTTDGTTVCLGGTLIGGTYIDGDFDLLFGSVTPLNSFEVATDTVIAFTAEDGGGNMAQLSLDGSVGQGVAYLCSSGTVDRVSLLTTGGVGASVVVDGANDCIDVTTAVGASFVLYGATDFASFDTAGGANMTINGATNTACLLNGSGMACVKLTGSTVGLFGTIVLPITPNAGTCSDSILVWNATTNEINKVPYVSGGTGTITGGTNGLSTSGANIVLGGILTGNTIIDTNDWILNICNGAGGPGMCIEAGFITMGDLSLATPYVYVDSLNLQLYGVTGNVCIDSQVCIQELAPEITLCDCSSSSFQLCGGVAIMGDKNSYPTPASSAIYVGGNFINLLSIAGGCLDLNITCNIFSDTTNLKGLEYAGDYEAQFTQYSLVDKGYVDAAIAASASTYTFTNGLTETTGSVCLGGALTEALTDIQVGTNHITICDGYSRGLSVDYGNANTTFGDIACTAGHIYINGTDVKVCGNATNVCVSSDAFICLCVAGGGCLELVNSGCNVFSDEIYCKGLSYFNDYSASFTDRSLVDKAYVDAQSGGGTITGATNGLNVAGAEIRLGGTLTGNTVIDVNGNSFEIGYPSNSLCAIFKNDCIGLSGGSIFNIIGGVAPYICSYVAPGVSICLGTSGGGFNPSMELRTCSAGGDSLYLSGSGCTIFTSTGSLAGILYAGDYSASFISRSLVDKGYVDSRTTGTTLHAFTITGDGTSTGFTVNHNFNQTYVGIEIVKNTSPYPTIYTDTTRPTTNDVCVTFDVAPDIGQEYKVLIFTSGSTGSDTAFMPLIAQINQVSATTYTIQSGDAGKNIEFTSLSATTITLPTGLTVGFQAVLVNIGGGSKTMVAGSGATLYTLNSNTIIAGAYNAATVYYREVNKWVGFGNLS